MVRGYLAKSADELNCLGLIKIEATVMSDCSEAAFISSAWPKWSAPIVGTKPTVWAVAIECARRDRSSSMLRKMRIV
ncbi:unannotated protein [freshwater metagenome]|uniref:Unannotated protein n=1 Tax=freshwater metagenome TaxID=449393 RepID=A0A6J7UPA6_9ZZZZ